MEQGALPTGDPSNPSQQLFALVYWDLHRMAASLMAGERKEHTLQPTALVHEAYLRLADSGGLRCWNDQQHFLALASQVMQHVLADHARGKNTLKRGRGFQRNELEAGSLTTTGPAMDILALQTAIEKLEKVDERKAALVRLRYYDGLTLEESAAALGMSLSGVKKAWAFARCWLRVELEGEEAADGANNMKETD
jgi:RNA polymerase sigma factor (TIGR02999 family)